MIHYKSEEEIEIMARCGKILAEVLFEVLKHVKPGVTELELDAMADKLIKEKGGQAGFKLVEGYHHAVCISTNEVVVHGIPTNNTLKEGDVVGIDCGVFLQGYHTDMAQTMRVRNQKSKIRDQKDEVDIFLETGEKALGEAIEEAKIGNRVGHISKTIQDLVEKKGGYSIVRSLVGHGVGKSLHEEPEVPGFLSGKIENTPLLKEGMTIAIEVIYNMGKRDVVYASNDGWTIKSKDDSMSGVFERTVLVSQNGPIVLTQ